MLIEIIRRVMKLIAIKNVMKEVMVIVEAIEESDLFKGVSPEFLQEIGRAGEIRSFKRGTIICRADEKARYLYQLIEGNIDIMVAEKETIHFTVNRPGEIFGWSALVEPYKYTATALCNSDARVVRMSREAIESIIMKYPSDGLAILRHLTGIISQRLRHAYLYIYNKG
ncbi:MAG: cyclic nucleotide-binding protein [Deltaproteobacteria bacterium]|nr:cyclic nucleotide-binding protein [Deltaproteobacteria bacterium]